MKDYYQILEVDTNASPDEIKEQYRLLVQAWHPDRFTNSAQKLKAEEKLKEINVAYAILHNPTKRADYDARIRLTPHNQNPSNAERHRTETQSQQDRAEAERRRKEAQWQQDRVNWERWEADRRRKEETAKQRLSQLDQEISALTQEIDKLSTDLPPMPFPVFILFILGGILILGFGISENPILFLSLGALSFAIGIVLSVRRSKFYRENHKPILNEIQKRKQQLQQLVQERLQARTI